MLKVECPKCKREFSLLYAHKVLCSCGNLFGFEGNSTLNLKKSEITLLLVLSLGWHVAKYYASSDYERLGEYGLVRGKGYRATLTAKGRETAKMITDQMEMIYVKS